MRQQASTGGLKIGVMGGIGASPKTTNFLTNAHQKSSHGAFVRGNNSGYLTRGSVPNYGEFDTETHNKRYSPQRDGSNDSKYNLKPIRGNHTILSSTAHTGFTRDSSAGKDYSYSNIGSKKQKRRDRLNSSMSYTGLTGTGRQTEARSTSNLNRTSQIIQQNNSRMKKQMRPRSQYTM